MKKWHHIRETVTVYDSERQISRPVTVDIKIDSSALARVLAARAAKSKVGKASALYSTILATAQKKIT